MGSSPDPFEPDVELNEQWLQAEPLISAKTLMERLISHNPERYGKHHLRTLQRRLRGYRLQQIKQEIEQALAAPYPVEERNGQDEEKLVLANVNENGEHMFAYLHRAECFSFEGPRQSRLDGDTSAGADLTPHW